MRVRLDVVLGSGPPSTLHVEAASPDVARQAATADGYTVLRCRTVDASWNRWSYRPLARSRGFDVLVFVEQLRDLLVAGLSVIEALDALRRGAIGPAAQSITALMQSLRNGHTLSDALTSPPDFPKLLVALVRSSELTSQLPQALTRFVEHEQRVAEVRHKLVSAAIYPILLIGVGTLVLFFLFFYVTPRFARVFDGMSGELPWSAQAMVAWSGLLSDYRPLMLGIAGSIVAGIGCVGASASARAAVWRRLLAWSPVKARVTAYFLARWYRATGMLVSGGIALPEALSLSNPVLPVALRAHGQRVERGVRDGLTPSAAHVAAGMATPIAEQLLLAGERTGDLGDVLSRIAQFHESDVARTLERSMRALEPVVMVAIGLGVGVVVVLMYMPIFELASSIQ